MVSFSSDLVSKLYYIDGTKIRKEAL